MDSECGSVVGARKPGLRIWASQAQNRLIILAQRWAVVVLEGCRPANFIFFPAPLQLIPSYTPSKFVEVDNHPLIESRHVKETRKLCRVAVLEDKGCPPLD